MKKRAALRTSFVVTFAGTASLALAATGCIHGEVITNPPPPEATCPGALPTDGEACDTETTPSECLYKDPDCGWDIKATCSPSGEWTREYTGTCNPPPVLECPPDLPMSGASCFGEGSCTYQDECGQPITATCPAGQWEVQFGGICNPPAPCEYYTSATDCEAGPSCRWLAPGCGDGPLPAAGCFDAAPCADDASCGALTCTQVSVVPDCVKDGCDACGVATSVCL